MKKRQTRNIPERIDHAEILQISGLRATLPRLALFAFFEKNHYPKNVQEIVACLKKPNGKSGVDQVTVYRAVEALTRAKILREVNLHGERPRYELVREQDDHHHIVCTNCHKIEDFVGCDYPELKKKALRQSSSFLKITGHSLDLYGLCTACAK